MKKQNTKKLLNITLICGLLALTACTNKTKERRAQFLKNIEQRAELRMSSMRFELDANGDNVLTCADSTLSRARLLERFDANGDQSLSSNEYQEVRMSERRFVYFDFTMVDKDQSNSINQSEFSAIPNDRLMSFDLNKNCEISDDELKKGIIASILQNNASPTYRRQRIERQQPGGQGRKGKGGRRGNQGNRGNISPL